jgi:RNA polymerase sigma-70 factor (ECF subfamily)
VSPEWALIRQAIAGNSDSQNALFAAYSSRLYRTAFAVLRNREDAEDALQDGLCNAHIHLRSFQGRSSFVTWLTRIVVNSALMIRRKQNSRVALSLHEIMENEEGRQGREFADDGPNPEEIYCVAEIDGLLAAEVGKLPAKLQTAFQLSEVDGFSIAESSQRLGVGKGAFKSRLMRARRRLTHELNRSLHARESRSLSL